MILVRELAQFSTSVFTVICHPGRWQIQTNNENHFDRVEGCAGRLFDELLPHTPVSGFGSNYLFSYKLGIENARERMARLVMKTGIPIPSQSPVSGVVKFSDKRSDYTLNIEISPNAKFGDTIAIAFNADFVIPTEKPHFELGRLLSYSSQALRIECRETANAIAHYIPE
jgi:hypothetical protein